MGFYGRVCLFSWLMLWSFRVQGDEAEIDFVCKDTGNHYLFCLVCLKKLPETSSFDIREIAAASINCTYESAMVAGQSVLVYSQNSTDKFQQTMKTCYDNFAAATKNFADSLESWQNQRDQDAVNQLNLGRENYYACADKVLYFPISPELIKEFNAVRQFSELAMILIPGIPS